MLRVPRSPWSLAAAPGSIYDAGRPPRPRPGDPPVSTTRPIAPVLLALVAAGAAPTFAQKKNPQGTPVLLLSGGQREHHGYREQAFYLAGLLEDTGRYRVTISEDAAILATPALKNYRVLI